MSGSWIRRPLSGQKHPSGHGARTLVARAEALPRPDQTVSWSSRITGPAARTITAIAVAVTAAVAGAAGIPAAVAAQSHAAVTGGLATISSQSVIVDGAACPDVMVIAARGTGEEPLGSSWKNPGNYKTAKDHGVGGTLLTFYDQLKKTRPDLKFSLQPVVYPVPDLSLKDLKTLFDFGKDATAGGDNIAADIKQTDTVCGHTVRYVLAGYSLGAWAVHKALHALAGTGRLDEIAGVALFGDPKFVPFQKIVRAYKLLDIDFGIAALAVDQRDNGVPNSIVPRTGSWCFPLDPICQVLPPPETDAWLAELAACAAGNKLLCAHLRYADKETGKAARFVDQFLPKASLWPHLTSNTPPDGTVGSPYSWTTTAAPAAAYKWTSSGSLPPGLSFSTAGVLAGTPSQADTFKFQVTATGRYGRSVSGQVAVTIMSQGFASGDLLVGTGNGLVAHYTSAGTLVSTLDTTTSSSEETGGCFAPGGEYYQTNFQDGSISKFAADGSLESSRWATVTGSPESCLVGADGSVYVGVVDSGQLLQFSSGGTLVNTFSPQTEDRGVDWLSWGGDSCTVRYTSEGTTVFQFDVCNGTQLAPFATGLPGPCFENASLSSGLLVACSSSVVRLDASGNVTQTYASPSSAMLFAVAAQPNASAFWVADYNGSASTVYEIDLSSGATITSFTPSVENDVSGLTIVP